MDVSREHKGVSFTPTCPLCKGDIDLYMALSFYEFYGYRLSGGGGGRTLSGSGTLKPYLAVIEFEIL